jgi:O-antigen/teichoic acid export membrane protein
MTVASALSHAAARGAMFTMAAQGSRIALQFVSVVVLARLLTPHDYGLLAIALVLVGLGEIFRDFGLTSASIQAPQLTRGQRDNLFWLSTAIGASLAAVLWAGAWIVGDITGQPELVGMTQWMSLTFVLNGLAAQHRAILMRELRLGAVAIADVAAAGVALAAAITAAALGAGYWALVIQQVGNALVALIAVSAAGRWMPRWYSRRHSVRAMLVFGGHLVGADLIQYAARQIDTVLIGMRFGTAALGLYDRSRLLVTTPLGQLRAPLRSVALPVLARIQSDQPRFDSWVTAAQLALGYTIGIPLAIGGALAEPVVAVALGDQWTGAAPLMRMITIAGILTTLSYVGFWVYLARGLGDQLLRYTLVSAVIKIVAIVVGSFFGLFGVAVAFAVHPAIEMPLSIAWLSRITPMPTRRLYLGAARVLGTALLCGLAAWGGSIAVADGGSWPMLLTGSAAGAMAAAATLVLPGHRRDAASLLAFARLMVARRQPAGDAVEGSRSL